MTHTTYTDVLADQDEFFSIDSKISMLKPPGRGFFISSTRRETQISFPVENHAPVRMEEADRQWLEPSPPSLLSEIPTPSILPVASNEMILAETSMETELIEEPKWPGNPPAHVAYLETPFVPIETILNSRYLITNFSITLPSDPLLDGREVVVYNNSVQTIIVRANLDGIFEICPHTTCRLAYLLFVNLWVVV